MSDQHNGKHEENAAEPERPKYPPHERKLPRLTIHELEWVEDDLGRKHFYMPGGRPVCGRLKLRKNRVIEDEACLGIPMPAGPCKVHGGKAGGPMREARLRSASQSVTERTRCSVLMLRKGPLARRPVVVIFEGSERALAVGRALARVYGCLLLVLAAGADAAAAAKLEAEAAAWLDRHETLGEVDPLADPEPEELGETLRARYAGIVVLDRQGALTPRLEPVLGKTDCSVLVLK